MVQRQGHHLFHQSSTRTRALAVAHAFDARQERTLHRRPQASHQHRLISGNVAGGNAMARHLHSHSSRMASTFQELWVHLPRRHHIQTSVAFYSFFVASTHWLWFQITHSNPIPFSIRTFLFSPLHSQSQPLPSPGQKQTTTLRGITTPDNNKHLP